MANNTSFNLVQALTMNLPIFIELWDGDGLPVYRISVADCQTDVKFGTARIHVPDLKPSVCFQLAAVVITALQHGQYIPVEKVDWKGPSLVHPYETLHIDNFNVTTN